ncbi:MAG: hypothetical protein V7695_14360 [Sulfitobacter sp.]
MAGFGIEIERPYNVGHSTLNISSGSNDATGFRSDGLELCHSEEGICTGVIAIPSINGSAEATLVVIRTGDNGISLGDVIVTTTILPTTGEDILFFADHDYNDGIKDPNLETDTVSGLTGDDRTNEYVQSNSTL